GYKKGSRDQGIKGSRGKKEPQRPGGTEVTKRVQGIKGSRGKDKVNHRGTEARRLEKRGSKQAGKLGRQLFLYQTSKLPNFSTS
ncbi:MAG: hypothetical protein N2738_08930, partial [Thermodesulfovibrionales bacterium]|nr:hypothetical protein [Thermodesulfovibrionales bacterium]